MAALNENSADTSLRSARLGTEVFFDSGGLRCAASLYRPASATGRVPCVVMGPGTSGTRDFGLPDYAERFAAAGFAALVFDYRHFGGSAGEPRQLIDLREQLDDYRAAIRFARSFEGIDGERVAIWGTSLSGGHVIEIAATDPDIVAVISQVPWMGIEYGRESPRSASVTLRLFAAALRDAIGGRLGRPPYLVPLVASAGEVGAFTDPEARAVLSELAAAAPSWRNEIAARTLLTMLRYKPGLRAKDVTVPLLICVADRDTAGSTMLALKAASEAPHAEVRRYPVGHFDVYVGAPMEAIVADEVTFLRTQLGGSGPR